MAALVRWAIVGLAFFSRSPVASPVVVPRPGSQQTQTVQDEPLARKLTGKFLHISDFHPDFYYKPYTSTRDDVACHRGSGPAGYWGAQSTNCDTPTSLVNATFDWIAANVRDDIDFVVWTGDSARHDSDEKVPRHAAEVLRTNRWIADKFAETFSSGYGDGTLSIPVVPSMGNNDFLPHNIFYPGPNQWLLQYLDIWRHFVPGEQHHSFQFGGWFSIEVVPDRLAVLSLNTMYFFARNAGVDGCAAPDQPGYLHLEWLRVHLQQLRERGVKAILVGHVPPARTGNKQLWDESCWQKYTLWLRQYRDVVIASLYGHMNIDHFIVADARDIGDDLGGRKDVTANLPDPALDDTPSGELSIQSKCNYLADLRSDWSKLPRTLLASKRAGKKSGGGSGGDGSLHGGKWGERYSLAIVSPSIVPNYLPTLRIYEYNITGLEDAPVWRDDPDKLVDYEPPENEDGEGNQDSEDHEDNEDNEHIEHNEGTALDAKEGTHQELKRHLDLTGKKDKKGKKGKKGKNGGKKKPHRPHDPDLIIPSPPSPTTEPGPAYSPQPLTLTGYTQWFANLTRLNNLPPEGIKKGQKPPQHLPFEFEVEYNTLTDEWYRVSDLTVRSYVKLAYRIARRDAHDNAVDGDGQGDGDGDEFASDFAADYEEGTETDADDNDHVDGLGGKGKGKKKRKQSNKLWLRFLGRAFVGTVSEEDLDQWDD